MSTDLLSPTLDTSLACDLRDYPRRSGKTTFMKELYANLCQSGANVKYVPAGSTMEDESVDNCDVFCLDEYTDAFVEKLQTNYPSSRIYGMRTPVQ